MTNAIIPNRPLPSDQRSIALILADFDAITSVVNGNLDANNFTAATGKAVGANQAGQKIKGVTVIPGAESTGSGSFVTLPTPDQVTNIVLDTNGLIEIDYRAIWQESVSNTALACIYLGSNQVMYSSLGSNVSTIAATSGTPGIDVILTTMPNGLVSQPHGGTGLAAEVSTGMTTVSSTNPAGGTCKIWADPGTYTVSIRYMVQSGGTVTVKNRKLWVKATSYA